MIEVTDRGFRVVAPMTIALARALLAAGEARIAGSTATMEIDLSSVEAADSAAIAVLLGWLRTAGRKAEIRLVGVPAAVASLADLYGVTELLPLS